MVALANDSAATYALRTSNMKQRKSGEMLGYGLMRRYIGRVTHRSGGLEEEEKHSKKLSMATSHLVATSVDTFG